MGTPHSYTADTLETALRNTVGDPESNPSQRWTATECADYLNRGMNQVALHLPMSYETSWEVTTADGTRTYLLPTDFISDKRVEWVQTASTDERTLLYLDETEWKNRGLNEDKSSTGEPVYYTYQKNLGDEGSTTIQPKHIVLYPVPNAAKTLRIYGFKIPEVMTQSGTEVPELATPMLEAVIFWAAYLMSADDNDDVRADRFEGRFTRQIQLIRSFQMDVSFSRAPMLKPWLRNGGVVELPHQRRVQ